MKVKAEGVLILAVLVLLLVIGVLSQHIKNIEAENKLLRSSLTVSGNEHFLEIIDE